VRQTKDSIEFMEKIALLDPQQRDHMRIVVEKIMDCYLSTDQHAVLVIGNDKTELATLLTINCDELEAAVVLGRLHTMFIDINADQAPPKELLN
jgi:hypothetical protein